MDRKSIIILVACFLVLILLHPLADKLFPPKPLPPGATNALAAALSLTNGSAASQIGRAHV